MPGIPACVKRSALFLLSLLTVPIGCKPSEFLSESDGPGRDGREMGFFSSGKRKKDRISAEEGVR